MLGLAGSAAVAEISKRILRLTVLIVVRVAVAIIIWIATAVSADSNVQSPPLEIEISDLQAARLLITAGRLRDAHVFLERALPQNEEEWIERLFLLGRIEMRLGMPKSAVTRFETVLERRPDLTRVRLELAAAYYAAGIDDRAKFHFKLSLTENLPFSVEAAAEAFLRQIDARKRWSASFSFSLLPESNPSRRTDREIVSVGGLPFELNEDSRPSSGVGGLISGGVSYSPIISDNLRGLFAVSGAAKFYQRSEWNDITIAADLGVTQLYDRGSMSEGLRFGRQWIGGERLSKSIGIWTQNRWRMSKSVQFEMPVIAEYRKYDTQAYRDGWQISFIPGFNFALDERTLVGVEPRLELIGAQKHHHRKNVVGLGLGFKRAFESGFSISLNPSFHRKRHAAEDPLFGVKRLDKQFIFSVGFSHQSFQYKGYAPSVSYAYERNRSNIPVHEYRNQGVNINISRLF